MAREFARTDRVGQEIQKEVAMIRHGDCFSR